MRKTLVWMLVCFLVLGLFGHALAGQAAPALTLVSEHPLSFSKRPLRIEKAEALPTGSLAVFYFAQGENQEEETYWLDLFSAAGERLLSKKLSTHVPDADPHPYAQLLIKSDGFVCEYYPDVTTMEVCYRSVYTFEGRALQTDQKTTFRYGDASYAKNLGPFILGRQAHAYDEEPADPYTRLEIQHVPTGQALTTKTWDYRPASLVDAENRLWIVQKNEQENLEIRTYTALDTLQEQLIEVDAPSLKTQEFTFVSSGVLYQGNAYFLIYQTNTAYALLTYDLEQQQITASRALTAIPEVDYIASLMVAGQYLLAVNGVWDESAQKHMWTLSVLDGPEEQVPLHFVGKAAVVFTDGESDSITAIEKEAESGKWFIRRYLIVSP